MPRGSALVHNLAIISLPLRDSTPSLKLCRLREMLLQLRYAFVLCKTAVRLSRLGDRLCVIGDEVSVALYHHLGAGVVSRIREAARIVLCFRVSDAVRMIYKLSLRLDTLQVSSMALKFRGGQVLCHSLRHKSVA